MPATKAPTLKLACSYELLQQLQGAEQALSRTRLNPKPRVDELQNLILRISAVREKSLLAPKLAPDPAKPADVG